MPKSGIFIKSVIVKVSVFILLAAAVPVQAAGAGSTVPSEQPAGETRIVVETKTKTLTVYKGNKLLKSFKVAIGKSKTPTPIGEWRINRKARNWGDGFGTRWIGLTVPWGLYGIHGTNKPWSIGSRASHGCIRMLNRDVEQLYEMVGEGDRVCIKGQIYSPYYEQRRPLFRGERGSDVMMLQLKLKEQGYLAGGVDGIFGYGTERALKKFQKDHDFEETGRVDADIYAAVGL